MWKRLALLAAVAFLLFAGAGFAYYLNLTAPVAEATAIPVAATLAAPAGAVTRLPEPTPAPATPAPAATAQGPATPTSRSGTAAPAAAVVTPATRAATSAPRAATGARVYRIDSSQSEMTYRVQETFFDQRGLSTAVGKTRAITGDILVDRANPPASQVGEIVVNMAQFATDDPQRDNSVRRGYLETARFPVARFKNGVISGLPGELREGQPFSFTLAGDLTVRDVTRPVTWAVEATLEGDVLRGRATTDVKMSDFGIQPPNLRFLRAEDEVALELVFVSRAVAAGAQ